MKNKAARSVPDSYLCAKLWSECPRCDNGIYNGRECAICWGTGRITESLLAREAAAQPTLRLTLECVECGKKYDPEGWDPMGGDCPTVRDLTTGEVIRPPEIDHNDH